MLSERDFCEYCGRTLTDNKEKMQGYHTKCGNEIKKNQELSFLEKDDYKIINELEKIFIFCFYDNNNDKVIFSPIKQNLDSFLEIFLVNESVDFKETKIQKIRGIKSKGILKKDMRDVWNIFKEKEIWNPTFFKKIEINNLSLILKIRDLMLFPEIIIRENSIIIKDSKKFLLNNEFNAKHPLIEIFLSDDLIDKIICGFKSKTNMVHDSYIEHIANAIPDFFKIYKQNLLQTLDFQNRNFLYYVLENFSKKNLGVKFNYTYNQEKEEEKIILDCSYYEKTPLPVKDDYFDNNVQFGRGKFVELDENNDWQYNYYEIGENELKIELGLDNERINRKFSTLTITCKSDKSIEEILELDWDNLSIQEINLNFKKSDFLQPIVNRINKFQTLKSLILSIYSIDADQTETINFNEFSSSILENVSIRSRSFLNIKNFSVLRHLKSIYVHNVSLEDNKINYFINEAIISGYKKHDNPLISLPNKIVNLRLDDSIFTKIRVDKSFECKQITFAEYDILSGSQDYNSAPLKQEMLSAIIKIINNTKGIETVEFNFFISNIEEILSNISSLKSIFFSIPNNKAVSITGEEPGLKSLKELRLMTYPSARIPNFINKLTNLKSISFLFACIYDIDTRFIHDLNILSELPFLTTIFTYDYFIYHWKNALKRICPNVNVYSEKYRLEILTNGKISTKICELCKKEINFSSDIIFGNVHLDCKIDFGSKLKYTEDKLDFFFNQILDRPLPEKYSGIYSFEIRYKMPVPINFTQMMIFLQYLPGLKFLTLENMGLEFIDESIKKLKNIMHLTISGNKLKNLPKELSKLKNLTFIFSYGNEFRDFPEVESLVNIETLTLYHGKMSSLPENISKLKRLRSLNLSNNKLKNIPYSISGLRKIEKMELNSNFIRTIPPTISNLEKLLVLDLSQNNISELPVGFGNFKKIKALLLNYNKLREFPKELLKIKTLLTLSLAFNEIETIPKEIKYIYSLKILNLVGNKENKKSYQTQHKKTLLNYTLNLNTWFIKRYSLTKLKGDYCFYQAYSRL